MKSARILMLSLLICSLFTVFSNADQYNEALKAIADKDYERGCELLQPFPEDNKLEAMTVLGTMYVNRFCKGMDAAAGRQMIMDAAEQGYAQAGELVAAFNYDDAIISIRNEDFIKAAKLLTPLAEENHLAAKTLMGVLYVKGDGVEEDTSKGLNMIMDAAAQGYEHARLVAIEINTDLAEMGDVSAIHNVGYMCLHGWAGEHDPDQCIEWLEVAADMGYEKSVRTLSQLYKSGELGVTPDKEKADYYNSIINNSND